MRALKLSRLLDMRLEAGCFMLAVDATRHNSDRRVTLKSPAPGVHFYNLYPKVNLFNVLFADLWQE
jgi:hypothetical protein